MVIDAMGSESEELRLSVEGRLARIEERCGQLVLDRSHLYNAIANLRKTVQALEHYKLKMETRDNDTAKREKKTVIYLGVWLTIANLIIGIMLRFWPAH